MKMSEEDVKQLIKDGESKTLDFKMTVHAKKIAKTIAAFANTQGGSILVGVMDDGVIVGVDPEEEMYALDMAAEQFCQPPIQLDYEKVEMEERRRTVLVAKVPDSPAKPHEALHNAEWNFFIRSRDKSLVASKAVVHNLNSEWEVKPQIPEKLSKIERIAIEYMRSNEKLTIRKLSRLANTSERQAKRTLIGLLNEGVLHLHELEREDYFTLAV